MLDVNKIIQSIRESFRASITVYTMGNCYQLYEILKTIFPDAEAFESGGHVFTKIDGEFYDIKGKNTNKNLDFFPVLADRIESLSKNKWTDQRRETYRINMINQKCKKVK